MNYPTAIVISVALIAGAAVLSSTTEANHPHASNSHIIAHEKGGVWHMHGDKVRHCVSEQDGSSTSKAVKCGVWQLPGAECTRCNGRTAATGTQSP